MFPRGSIYVFVVGLCLSGYPLTNAQILRPTLTKIAGSGHPGFSGDGKDARLASIGAYTPLAIGSDDVLYLADEDNNRIRAIDLTTNTIDTVAGNGTTVFRPDTTGKATSVGLNRPSGIAIAPDGTIYLSDTNNCAIRKMTLASPPVISSIGGLGCGSDDSSSTVARSFRNPFGIAVSKDGSLYVADAGNSRIRQMRLQAQATVRTIEFSAARQDETGQGSAGDNGSRLVFPWYLAFDPGGDLYVSDVFNHRIYKLTLASTPAITAVVGNGNPGCNGDGGDPLEASISPGQIAFDATGQLFIADANHRIRKVTFGAKPVITTVAASTNLLENKIEGDTSVTAEIETLSGLAIDKDGNLFFSANAQIFKLTGVAASAAKTEVSSPSGTVEVGHSVTLQIAGARNSPGVLLDQGKALYPKQTFRTDRFGKALVLIELAVGAHSITAVIGISASAPIAITVKRHTQTITFKAVAQDAGDPIPLEASASSNLPVSFSAHGACTVSGGSLSRSGSGHCSVTASQTGNEFYAPAEPVIYDLFFAALKQKQEISFAATPKSVFRGSVIALSATATSSLPVSLAACGSCSLKESRLRMTAAGSCTVTASQAGDDRFAEAIPVARTFTISNPIAAVQLAVDAPQLTYPGVVSVAINVAQNGSPDGTVEIFDGGTSLATIRVESEKSFWLSGGLSTGTHRLSAIYRRTDKSTAKSSLVTVKVSPAPVSLRAVCSTIVAKSVVCSASAISTFGPAIGFVTYRLDDGKAVTVPMFSGIAEFKLNLSSGKHSLSMQYPKQGNFAASQLLVRSLSGD